MEIHPRIHQIRSFFYESEVVLYLIRGEKNAIIDTGVSMSPQNHIAPALKDLGLTLADIDFILNTHAHCDHIGGNATIRQAGHARICIHAAEVIPVEDHHRYFIEYFEPLAEVALGKEHVQGEWAIYSELAGPETKVDTRLQDNDTIDIGSSCQLRVIHLPGHSPGSVGFYWEKEGVLFTGDSVSGLHDESGCLPVISDFEAYQRSLERLQGMSLQLLLTSHRYRGLKIKPSASRQGVEIKEYLQDSREAANQIYRAIKRVAPHTAGQSLKKVAERVIGEIPKEMGFKSPNDIPQSLFSFMTILNGLGQVPGISR